jgi:hypothetical protein
VLSTASIRPANTSSENLAPAARQAAGSGGSSRRARAIAAGVASRTSLPVSPSRTMSSAPPRRGATTGVPHACASAMTIPNSSTDGQTSACAQRYSSRSSSSSTQPVKVARPA